MAELLATEGCATREAPSLSQNGYGFPSFFLFFGQVPSCSWPGLFNAGRLPSHRPRNNQSNAITWEFNKPQGMALDLVYRAEDRRRSSGTPGRGLSQAPPGPG